jgi:hypothetical protein
VTRRLASALLVCGIVLIGIVWFEAAKAPSVHGDTAVLVRGSAVANHCLAHGQFVDCDAWFKKHPTNDSIVGVSSYPLFQYLPSMTLRAAGLSLESTLRVLVALNALSLVAIGVLAWLTLRRHSPPLWAPLVAVALVASPLLWYGKVAFGEELAAALILAAVAAAIFEVSPVWLGVLVVVASITKETNPPFVFALVAVCLLARGVAGDTRRRNRLLAAIIGAGIGFALNAGFNIFRYGVPRNVDYTRPSLYAPNVTTATKVFGAEWFAPNGGLVWWWPLAPALILTVAIIVIVRKEPWTRPRLAAPFVALLFFGQLLLLAWWWSPFGWITWGPRLVIPMTPALLVAVCVLGAPYATKPMARFLRSVWLFPVALVAIVIGLPQAVALNYGLALTKFFGPKLSGCADGRITTNRPLYYRCMLETAWSKQPYLLRQGMRGIEGAVGWAAAIAFVGTAVALFALARAAAADRWDEAPGSDTETRPNGSPDVNLTVG